jgi:hypothetical protein
VKKAALDVFTLRKSASALSMRVNPVGSNQAFGGGFPTMS